MQVKISSYRNDADGASSAERLGVLGEALSCVQEDVRRHAPQAASVHTTNADDSVHEAVAGYDMCVWNAAFLARMLDVPGS